MITIDGGTGVIKHNGVEMASQKMVDSWRLSTTLSNNGDNNITANWERNDTQFELIGAGLSESSGVWTFPTTGKYQITYCGTGTGNSDRYIVV